MKLLAVCLAAMTVLALAATTTASAAPDRLPSEGRCITGGAKEFEEPDCNIETHKGPYSWCWINGWRAACPRTWVEPWWELAEAKIATAHLEITCKELGSEVEHIVGAVLYLYPSTGSCSFKEGHVDTRCEDLKSHELEAALVLTESSTSPVGVVLRSASGTLLEATCDGREIRVGGAAIGTVPSGRPETELPFTFEEKGGSTSELYVEEDEKAEHAALSGQALQFYPGEEEKKEGLGFEIKCGTGEPGSEEEVKSESC